MKKMLCMLIWIPLLTSCKDDVVEPTPIDSSIQISFSNDLQPLFDSDCKGCHQGGSTYPPNLTASVSYSQLLTASPIVCPTYDNFIDTVNPENSIFYIKLLASPPCGSMMPIGSQWDQDKKNKVLSWIKQGAKNNYSVML